MRPTHHEYDTRIFTYDDQGNETQMIATIAVVGYTPGERGSDVCPPSPPTVEIEIRDRSGFPRPEWEAELSTEQFDQLREHAHNDWQAYADAELRAALAERKARQVA